METFGYLEIFDFEIWILDFLSFIQWRVLTRDAEPWHFWLAPAPAPAPGKHSGSGSGSGYE